MALVAVVSVISVVAVILGGCGGGTKTVSVASSPTSAQTTSHDDPTDREHRHDADHHQHTTSTAPAPARTRTAPEPAFAEKEKAASGTGASNEGLAAALAVVRAHGYAAKDTSDYHPNQTLRVLIGTGANSNDGYDKQAFFFVDGRYIGTDSSRPSAQLSVVSQGDTEVTLAYALYRPGNPLCCPAGGQAQVRFQLNNGRLTTLDPIPPVNSTTGPSRQ